MPQTDFFICNQERAEFAAFAFDKKCKIIPDVHYDNARYCITSDINEYLKYCSDAPLLFLTNGLYSFYPLEFSSFEKDNVKKFYIKQRCGGPTIDFYTPIMGEIKNGIIGPGFIGIYPHYFHSDVLFVPNAELKIMYNILGDFIKNKSKRVKLGSRTYWIGNKTIELVKKGEFQLLQIGDTNLIDLI